MAFCSKSGLISVLIPDGEMYFAVKILRCLGKMRTVRTHILSRNKKTVARLSRYCSSCHYHTSPNDDDWINVIRNLVRELHIDVVLPTTDAGFEFVVRNKNTISEFVRLPYLVDEKLLDLVCDKWSFYCFAEKIGLPVPSSVLIGNAGQPLPDSLDLESVEFPALLKPTRLSGGYGIVQVTGPDKLIPAWKGKGIIKGQQYFLQSYIPGNHMTMAFYCREGRLLDYTLQRSLFNSDHYFGPMKAMEFMEDMETIELGAKLVSAMKWDGIADIDFILDERNMDVVFLELNPRFSQAVLGSLIAGVNFPMRVCMDAVGIDCPEMKKNNVKYAHPASHARMLVSRLLGRKTPAKVHWREGGLSFVARDPLPEFFEFVRKISQRLKMRLSLH